VVPALLVSIDGVKRRFGLPTRRLDVSRKNPQSRFAPDRTLPQKTSDPELGQLNLASKAG
jgi:hypothetical protein